MTPQSLADLTRRDAVILPLEAASREAAISVLVDVLAASWTPPDLEALKAAMAAREAAGSTGLGNGVAIPHARSPRVTAPALVVGRASRPIEFNSADGKLVSLVFLLVVPAADPKAHLKVLAALSRIAMDKKLLRRMNKAASPDELYQLLAEVSI
ncbi:MAG: PTS sugar transporter subunit IIA [Elusimicrobiota bacterium]|jgi:mannitol/fructose-specific phosphotransferase system IIA component (Ntr-type)